MKFYYIFLLTDIWHLSSQNFNDCFFYFEPICMSIVLIED